MKNYLSEITEQFANAEAKWIDSEIEKLVPKVFRVLAVADKTGFIASIVRKFINIEIQYADVIGSFDRKIRILKNGQVVAKANFKLGMRDIT